MRNKKTALCLVFSVLLTQCGGNPANQRDTLERFGLPEKKSVLLPNGETYAYLEQGTEQSEGETFLLLHGNMSSSVYYLPLFSRLPNARLIAPDLRGFGDSSYNAQISGLAELAEDVKFFADALGIDKAHVVGWSMGGGIAFELAANYPDFVSSLFIIEGVSYKGYPLFKLDGTAYSGKEELAVLLAPVQAALESKNASFFEQSANITMYPFKKPGAEESRLYIAETLKQRSLTDVNWALITFNMSGEHNGYAQGSGTFGNITCPVAFTCGERDMLARPATIRENAAALKGSALLEYEKCGHSPLVDCPDRLAADILAHAQESSMQKARLHDGK